MESTNGWTGGHYSLLRALLGAYIAFREPLLVPACAAFAVGFYDRLAAALLIAGLMQLEGWSATGVIWLLLAHLVVPAAPYGSWMARGRADPSGEWRLPETIRSGAVLAAVLTWFLRFALGAPIARADPLIVFALAVDPGWISPSVEGAATLFYDGVCGLCHRFVRFFLAEDRTEEALRFAPIGGETFCAAISGPERANLPDSLVLLLDDGTILLKSDAIREAGSRLGGVWRLLSVLAGLVPRALADRMYDRIASARRGLFSPPADVCPVMSPRHRRRFDP